MFISEKSDEIKWYWLDKKMHSIKINNNGNYVDLHKITDILKDTSSDNKEECKNILYLGLAMSGSPDAASGFLTGWLMRSIKLKDGDNWNIEHETEEVDEDEMKERLADAFEQYAKQIRKGNKDTTGIPTPTEGGFDGTELFE